MEQGIHHIPRAVALRMKLIDDATFSSSSSSNSSSNSDDDDDNKREDSMIRVSKLKGHIQGVLFIPRKSKKEGLGSESMTSWCSHICSLFQKWDGFFLEQEGIREGQIGQAKSLDTPNKTSHLHPEIGLQRYVLKMADPAPKRRFVSVTDEAIDEVLNTQTPKSTKDTTKDWVGMLANSNDENEVECDLKRRTRRMSLQRRCASAS